MKQNKILHIATDEKFINAANYIYDLAFPNKNDFFIILPNIEDYKIKHLSDSKNYFFYKDTKADLDKISSLINDYNLVVIHGFNYFQARLVNKNSNAIYNWILWGAEVYNWHKKLSSNLLGAETQKLYKKEIPKDFIRKFYHLYKFGKTNIFEYALKAMKKVNYFSVIHKEDYDLFLKNNVFDSTVKFSKFTYYPIEFIFENNKEIKVSGNNILIGNSAYYSGNHLESFSFLKNIELNDRKIITPLSYGNKKYANIIIEKAKAQFGNNFSPLVDFMPLPEYNKVLQTCGVVIMNHYRQEAVGNILSMMWMGAKVFLDEKNTFYHYLKRIGCTVYLTKEINSSSLVNLSDEEINHNRTILINEIGVDVIIKELKNDFGSIINN